MPFVLAAFVMLALLALGVAAFTGRLRATSCCSPGDPRQDARMRGAFEDEPQ